MIHQLCQLNYFSILIIENQSRSSRHSRVHTHAFTLHSQANRDPHYYYYIDKTTNTNPFLSRK